MKANYHQGENSLNYLIKLRGFLAPFLEVQEEKMIDLTRELSQKFIIFSRIFHNLDIMIYIFS